MLLSFSSQQSSTERFCSLSLKRLTALFALSITKKLFSSKELSSLTLNHSLGERRFLLDSLTLQVESNMLIGRSSTTTHTAAKPLVRCATKGSLLWKRQMSVASFTSKRFFSVLKMQLTMEYRSCLLNLAPVLTANAVPQKSITQLTPLTSDSPLGPTGCTSHLAISPPPVVQKKVCSTATEPPSS